MTTTATALSVGACGATGGNIPLYHFKNTEQIERNTQGQELSHWHA